MQVNDLQNITCRRLTDTHISTGLLFHFIKEEEKCVSYSRIIQKYLTFFQPTILQIWQQWSSSGRCVQINSKSGMSVASASHGPVLFTSSGLLPKASLPPSFHLVLLPFQDSISDCSAQYNLFSLSNLTLHEEVLIPRPILSWPVTTASPHCSTCKSYG